MIKAVLFDFDGTLIDTNELIFNSYKIAFKEVLCRDIGMEEILKLYGRPLYPSLMKYGEAGERLYKVYREFNEKNHDDIAKPFDKVHEGIEMLISAGYRTGIVTSKRLHLVERGIKNVLKMDGMFDVIVTPEDTQKSKPDPEPVLCACKKLGIKPEEAVYVGDSIFDLEAGRAAGTQICAVKYSVTPHSSLLEFNPEYFVDTIKEFAILMGCKS